MLKVLDLIVKILSAVSEMIPNVCARFQRSSIVDNEVGKCLTLANIA